MFSTEHVHEVAESVLLCDPKGNMFQVLVQKREGEAYFGQGWNEVGKFYGLELGGWARLIYARSDRFLIKLKDRLDLEVDYPSPPTITWLGDTPQKLAACTGDIATCQFVTICQKPDLFHVLEKTLTVADIYSGRLVCVHFYFVWYIFGNYYVFYLNDQY